MTVQGSKTKAAAANALPFSDFELDSALRSLHSLAAPGDDINWDGLRTLYSEAAHHSHKDWKATEHAATKLADMIGSSPSVSAAFSQLLEYPLIGGGWDAASAAAATRPTTSKPWVVLVTGLNGIRKTSSIYQEWFKEVLKQALGDSYNGSISELPGGGDSFFRQLDFIVATVANEEFKELYGIDDLSEYAARKDGIFARYRTIAEIMGALLLKAAQRERLNIFVETSGRDVGMYTYVDHFFPDECYRKLVINFGVNDVKFAERSVDTRMAKEMRDGRHAVLSAGSGRAELMRMIQTNAGGPYGSAILQQVQAESRAVWERVARDQGVGQSWLKASISIWADEKAAWTASASSEGEPLQRFAFAPLPRTA
eukprot:CAMPEP_0119380750 /NCGR_PEP_ID=MMETSP1334-20130426/57901_1 /TAXON_ID=127549 /ORGANISM="Calcidiscus leptoporus, Strain RCC1130" /LENGTH=369 /DNA_ID=CAMNT_0007400681 /DNA_START=117 /DNA_END=1226 /DNA_ORIENTATION=+